ncbi:MAG TPA: acyl carrier protein [Dongiaceae bacterium]|jgi:acyl carrier protein|nr:acyl carrier protein [Dongiaceae bacterium]
MLDGILANAEPAASRMLDALAPLLRAHASGATADLAPEHDLHADLGLDIIALAELAVAIEEEFGIDVDATDLAACRTIRALGTFVADRTDQNAF